jgi:hypothetical protein
MELVMTVHYPPVLRLSYVGTVHAFFSLATVFYNNNNKRDVSEIKISDRNTFRRLALLRLQ